MLKRRTMLGIVACMFSFPLLVPAVTLAETKLGQQKSTPKEAVSEKTKKKAPTEDMPISNEKGSTVVTTDTPKSSTNTKKP